MTRLARWKTFAAWLGIVGLAVAAAVPATIVKAAAPETVVLCTGHGLMTVQVEQGGAPAGKASGRAQCECCLQASPMALANQAAIALRRVPVWVVFLAGSDAVRVEPAFDPEQARAPPTV